MNVGPLRTAGEDEEEDAALASETISVLMGNKVGPRRELILEESAKIESIEELDI